MSSSLTKNFIYNFIYQCITLFLPLITVPYVSRIFGPEGIGDYSYTFSISQYFVIFGTLGIPLYGSRQIAYVKDDKKNLSKVFWSITVLKCITTFLALIIYLCVLKSNETLSLLYILQGINILAAMFDISWLFIGLEDLEKTVKKNIIIKIIGVVIIFIFVKKSEHIYLYILVNTTVLLLGNLVMWIYLPKTVSRISISKYDIQLHFIPIMKLFIPQVAIQIYSLLDRTMLGALASISDVGLYDQSQKILRLILTLITSMGTVMLPRMSTMYVHGDNQKLDNYLNKSLVVVSYVSVPMIFGLWVVSSKFVPWFFGNNFDFVSILLCLLAPIILFIALGNVVGTQYLLPTNRTREFTIAVIVGVIINIVLNMILIPSYKVIGACIATLISEFSVMLIQFIILKSHIKILVFFKNLIKYILVSSIMFVCVNILTYNMTASILSTLIQSILGIFVYFNILVLIKDEISLSIFNKFLRNIFRIGAIFRTKKAR